MRALGATGVCVGAIALFALACPLRSSSPRNLLLISVDTLRADRIEPERMPRLSKLASESERFERAWAPAPFTLPSISSLLTGRDPQETGIQANLARLPAGIPTLATRLADLGFTAVAVVSSAVLTNAARLNQGFDHYDDRLPHREARRITARERRATATTKAALEALDALVADDARFFLWVHYQDPHGPYTPPPVWLRRGSPKPGPGGSLELSVGRMGRGSIPEYQYLPPHRDPDVYRARYDAEVRYADFEMGRLLYALRKRGVWDDTAIVFTADHGESLGEQDYWFAHGDLLNEASLRVPLLIRVPGRSGRDRSDPASLVDVVPTLAALYGFEAPDLRGRDLLAPGAESWRGPVFFSTWNKVGPMASHGVLRDGYKFVRSTRSAALTEKLFRMPDEERNAAAEAPEVLAALRTTLDAHLTSREPPTPTLPPPVTEESRDALRAMGYLAE